MTPRSATALWLALGGLALTSLWAVGPVLIAGAAGAVYGVRAGLWRLVPSGVLAVVRSS